MPLTQVFLPGNMCDARLWSRMPADAETKDGFHADLSRDDSIAAMASRVLAETAGRLMPIGFSMGAIVAVEMAVQAPDRITGMVLAGYNATSDLPERAAHRPEQQAEVRDGGLERVLVEELKPNYLAAENGGDAALLGLLRDMGMSLGPDVFVRQSEALRLRYDRRPALRELRVPVCFACGIEDTLCSPDWHREWAAMVPGSQLAVIAGAGHLLPLEQPASFAKLIAQWRSDNTERLK